MTPKLNTIYIISKGRPQCVTAQSLEKMNYNGEWYIVCGNNDETIPEYRKRWGDRVLVFDWYEQVKTCDVMDPLGFETRGSGCVPVRNAVHEIAKARGEARYWEFDDDYTRFYRAGKGGKWRRMSGDQFEVELLRIAELGHRLGMANIGIALGAETRPEVYWKIGRRVFNMHNLPTDEALRTPWRGRMNEDLINAIDTWTRGAIEFHLKYLMVTMEMTQQTSGGNTEIYLLSGTVTKTAYAVMAAPANVKLVEQYGRYHHRVNWDGIVPKIISARYANGR